MKSIGVYDGNSRKRLCYLQNAYNIKYEKKKSELWTAAFSLPYGDLKNKYCTSMNFVEIWDIDESGKDKYIGLYRIMPSVSTLTDEESNIVYSLEHVFATLLDDTMIGWEEIGNIGVFTRTVINYILSKQTVQRWILGECDYNHQYLYGWQDENLLSALFSVTNSFVENDYRWEFDTKQYPWTLNLKRTSEKAVTDIRYKKNINGITKTLDPTNLTTRLYCYGYGEADNRLTIKSVNNGIPYLDSPNIAKYGQITRVWKDERFIHEESLFQSGKAMLAALEEPIVSYEIDVATVRKAADLEAGDMVRVVDDGTDIYTRVIEVSKDDVSGAPLVGKVILANKNTNIAQSVADMADRQRIATTYSQGAESLFADSLYDNADENNPAELSFVIPENAVHVNEILFSAKLTSFRAYSKATQGGGASSTTTQSGGGTSTSSGSGGESQTTSNAGGNQQTTSNSGGNSQSTSSAGGNTSAVSSSVVLAASNIQVTDDGGIGAANHNHGIVKNTSLIVNVTPKLNKDGLMTGVGLAYTAWSPSGAHNHGSHDHNVNIPAHTHTVNVPSHSHTISLPAHTHTVNIPSHNHSVDIPSHTHNFNLPNHTHDIQYGIYKGTSASSMTVQIDDTTVGIFDSSTSNINLIAYISKNSNGDVLRGQHTIKITPNSLTRVECNIQIRLFTNAHGAGQY